MLPSKDDTCQACLIVPAGENQEGANRPQAAHACEHICCAFNGGFKDAYGFLRLRDDHGIVIGATTHANYTQYCLRNIPCKKRSIAGVVRFLAGIFSPAGYRSEAGEKEMRVIRSEIDNEDPTQSLMWTMAYWIRQGTGRPTEAAIHHAGLPSITIDTALGFHKEYYQPSKCVMVVMAPEKGGAFTEWDTMLLQHMSSAGTRGWGSMVPNRYTPGKLTPDGCAACSVPRGLWEVPVRSKEAWFVCAVPFWVKRGEDHSLSEIRARSLIASCCRLSGSRDTDAMTLLDYLRTVLGITYNVNGTTMYVTDSAGRRGCIATIGAMLTRDLAHSEVSKIQSVLRRESSRLPGRGGLGGLTAWFVQNRPVDVVRETMAMCGIPLVSSLGWDGIRRAHSADNVERGDYAIIFSSRTS